MASMLDYCCILTQGGIVLWSKSFTGQPLNDGSPFLNEVIRASLVEQQPETDVQSATGNLTVKHTLDNPHGLIFAVAYPKILTLTYIPTLLSTIKALFLSLFGNILDHLAQLTSGLKDARALPPLLKSKVLGQHGWQNVWQEWEEAFMDVCRELEKQPRAPIKAASTKGSAASANASQQNKALPSQSSEAVADSELIAKNVQAFRSRQKAKSGAPAGGGGKKGSKQNGLRAEVSGSDTDATVTPPASSSTKQNKKGSNKKEMRKWDDSKHASKDDMDALDFSADHSDTAAAAGSGKELVDQDSMGQRDSDGLYEVADYQAATFEDDEDEDDEAGQAAAPSTFSSFLTKLSSTVGWSSRTLTAEDLVPILSKMSTQLMEKNVARDVVDSIIASVRASLLGVSVRGYGSSGLNKAVRQALSESLTRILTPRTPTDILLDIQRKRDPYVMTFVGVNGVGKSTNLSKVAFWLLQNHCKVLIAACDTFRSGAVEQLRVHVRNLNGLETGQDKVELYERGYGKDAAGIAKDAIGYAKENGFGVVLIDTAGRMQDNEPLMRALAKLVTVNKPDKVVFVGEALVGNEAVDQLSKFHTSLRQFSSASGAPRGIDGIILTKFDTIDDKVGAAVSMTYVTGQPLLFVGTGQTYSDLRMLRVEHIVRALLAQ